MRTCPHKKYQKKELLKLPSKTKGILDQALVTISQNKASHVEYSLLFADVNDRRIARVIITRSVDTEGGTSVTGIDKTV